MKLCGLVFRTFRSRSPDVLIPIYKSLVRRLVEYASPLWSPISVGNTLAVERVQRRFTKRLLGMRELSYADRLRHLQLPTLSQRRMYLDLVCAYKILHGQILSQCNLVYKNNTKCLRSNSRQLHKLSFSIDCRKHFFKLRVADSWNALPVSVVKSRTLETFKRRLAKHMGLV
jgi:hypothetical protein